MDNPEIKENAVYTPKETEELLKISTSTVKRMLKKGLIRTNKVGGQYRIMGKELLRVLSPQLEDSLFTFVDPKRPKKSTFSRQRRRLRLRKSRRNKERGYSHAEH